MSPEVFANSYTTSLTSACLNTDTSITVADSPPTALTSGQWRILIDSEYMLVTGVSGTGNKTFAVTRGSATGESPSPTAVSHLSGAVVQHMLTAGALGVPSQATQIAGGNLGSTYSLNLASGKAVQVTATLTANCTINVSGLAAGVSATLLLTQDATGGRTLSINDGSGAQSVTIAATAGAVTSVRLDSPDGTNLYVAALSVPGPTGTAAQWFTYSGAGTPTGLSGMNAGDKCLRSDGEIFSWTGTAWTDTTVSIKGTTGSAGTNGTNGAAGPAGSGITITRVASLPGSPTTDQVCSLVVDDTNGIDWLLRWDATKSLWRCEGSNAIFAFAAAPNSGSAISATTSYAAITGGLALTLPSVGTSMDVVIEQGSLINSVVNGLGPAVGVAIAGTALTTNPDTSAVPILSEYAGASNPIGTRTPMTRLPQRNVAAGAVITQQLKANITGNVLLQQMWVSVRCVQIRP